jgi:TonB-dependent starch-binding outer membrane protein SusC
MKKSRPGTGSELSWHRPIKTLLLRAIMAWVVMAIASFQLHASNALPEDGKISLKREVATVKEVLKEVERQTSFTFFYNHEQVDVSRVISINLKDVTLTQALEEIFKSTAIAYRISGQQVLLFRKDKASADEHANAMHASLTLTVTAPQQVFTVSGTVVDENNQSVPGVNVLEKGTTNGTATDVDGRFNLNVQNENSVLVFSFIGYVTEEVAVSGRSNVNVTLRQDVQALEEVVVVGYGTQKKSLITGAISSVDSKELATVSTSRSEQVLQGRTAGVYVLPASGSPGSNIQVRIRGTGSNGKSEPLYIVDGMRSPSGIGYLHPSEIASIEVLKDAASAAIYGAEGANGVVLVTTKTGGTNGTTNITYSGQYGVQSLGKTMEMMNAQQYGAYLEEAQTPGRPTAAEVAAAEGQGTNWFKEIVDNAPMQNHALNVSGGNDKSSYLLGGSIFKQQGIVGGEKATFNRYSLRLNSDHKIKDWLKIGNRLSYSHINRGAIAEDSEHGGIISNALLLDPLTPVVYTGAVPAHVQQAIDAGHPLIRDKNGNLYGLSKFAISNSNPFARMDITKTNTIENRVAGNIFADVELIKGLKFTTRYGIDANFLKNHGWNPSYWFTPQVMNLAGANVFDTYSNTFTWQWENFATYQKTIDKHNFSILAGTSALNNSYSVLSGTSVGMFREEDKFAYHDYVPDTGDRINGNEVNDRLSSYYGRLSYDFAGKYLFNATVRRDGSSLLPPGNRWGLFPSVSLGWLMSNEGFFPSESNLNHLKLRVSWGQNGNLSNLVSGQWASVITSQNIRYMNSNGTFLIGAEPANLANMDLTWETSEQFDVGIDVGFLNDKITLTADYFNKTTKDLLTPGTPPNFVGLPLPKINGGNVRNHGIEIELAYRELDSEFKYEIALNGTAIKNEATYLNPLYPRVGGVSVGTGWTATAFELGYPLWFFRGYKTDGIFQTQEQINSYVADNGIVDYIPKPGDPIVVDVNKDGRISPNDHTFIGSPHPDFVYGGRVNLSYKGFDFLVFAQGQTGNEILMGFNRNDASTTNRPAIFYNERWTGAGSTNSMFGPSTTNVYIYNSDQMVFDGSFMRIRQLQLGYTLPDDLLDRVKAKNIRVYVSLDDYFTFTKYPGLDPEAGSNNTTSLGIDRGVYPVPRRMMVGLNFNF